MNAGLQDAANLSWKLAAAVHGWAPSGLLDTYQSERHPVGRQVLRGSGALLRLAMLRSGPARAARQRIVGPITRIPAINRRIAGAVSGIDVSYAASRGAHPATGRRAADVALAGGGRLYELLRGGRFVLLGDGAEDLAAWADRVDQAVAAGRPGPVTLIRPDGYVAWASDARDPTRRAAALRHALAAWSGDGGRPAFSHAGPAPMAE
jgi:hypothetical protein